MSLEELSKEVDKFETRNRLQQQVIDELDVHVNGKNSKKKGGLLARLRNRRHSTDKA